MVNIRKIIPLFLVLPLSLFLLSCTENIAYTHKVLPYSTSDLAECNKFGDSLEHIQEENSDYYLGFVEVDDQGVFFNRDQFQNLTCELSSYAKSSGVLISVFVHGWHHNAKPGDDNINNFKESLITLSQLEQMFAQEKGISPRKTVGIFIGWRGESIDWDLFSNFTFWERKNTAEEIARRSVLEAFLRLEKIRDIPYFIPQVSAPQSNRLFIVGHSFGADVVYNALSSIMLERLIGAENKDCSVELIKGFGDFVFLINPAFESLQYINFLSVLSENNEYCDNQFPVFSILTSLKDKATKYAFPLGRKISTLLETYRDIEVPGMNGEQIIDQRNLDTTAIGHEEILFTHFLENYKTDLSSEDELIEDDCNVVRDFRNGWMAEKTEYVLKDVVLKNTNQFHPKTPYLVIKVDEDIIPDHNDIYAKQVLNFMRRLVVISTHEEVCSDS